MPAEDLWLYKLFGKKSTELTGYPNISIFHDFKYHPKQVITGGFDWIYEHLGQFFWTVEIWAPVKEAGVESYHFIDWYREHPPEDDLKLLAWSDRSWAARATSTGTRSTTRSSGRVELGGWNKLAVFRNPPAKYIEREVKRFPDVAHLAGAHAAEARGAARPRPSRWAADTWRCASRCTTRGYLPIYVTKRALERKVTRGVVYEIELPPGAELVARQGARRGRAARGPRQQAVAAGLPAQPRRHRGPGPVRVDGARARRHGDRGGARHERAGRVEAAVTLA